MKLQKHYNKGDFQGGSISRTRPYFEGWYFKQVSEDESKTVSFIPGISMHKEDPHCFVQCIMKDEDGSLKTYYYRYPIYEFEFRKRPFRITVGDSVFTKTGISVLLDDGDVCIESSFAYEALTDIVRSPVMPNIMGFFSFVPLMECNHEVLSMSHVAEGYVKVNDQELEWGNGKGYIEKDWGRSFPSQYLWVQSNNFDNESISIVLSVARVPFMGLAFDGYFCNLTLDGVEYRFATYNGSRIRADEMSSESFTILLANRDVRLKITGEIDQSEELKSPINGGMFSTIKEGLSGKVRLTMKDYDNHVLLDAVSHTCGIEIEL